MEDKQILIFEGPECAGKTTVISNLQTYLGTEHYVYFDELALKLINTISLGTSADFESEVALLTNTPLVWMHIENAIMQKKKAIVDRCWLSNIVYSQVRNQFNKNFCFNPEIHVSQSRILQNIFSNIFQTIAIVYLDVSPKTILDRWKFRNIEAHQIGHNPDYLWLETVNTKFENVLKNFGREFPEIKLIRFDGEVSPIKSMDKILSILGWK
jgi:thymidylate kinase